MSLAKTPLVAGLAKRPCCELNLREHPSGRWLYAICNQANLSISFRVAFALNFLEYWLKNSVVLGNHFLLYSGQFDTKDNLANLLLFNQKNMAARILTAPNHPFTSPHLAVCVTNLIIFHKTISDEQELNFPAASCSRKISNLVFQQSNFPHRIATRHGLNSFLKALALFRTIFPGRVLQGRKFIIRVRASPTAAGPIGIIYLHNLRAVQLTTLVPRVLLINYVVPKSGCRSFGAVKCMRHNSLPASAEHSSFLISD